MNYFNEILEVIVIGKYTQIWGRVIENYLMSEIEEILMFDKLK